MISVGAKLKALRIVSGLGGYRAFAKAHGLDPKSYWRMEEDKGDIKLSSIRRLAKIHGLSLEEFFRGVG